MGRRAQVKEFFMGSFYLIFGNMRKVNSRDVSLDLHQQINLYLVRKGPHTQRLGNGVYERLHRRMNELFRASISFVKLPLIAIFFFSVAASEWLAKFGYLAMNFNCGLRSLRQHTRMCAVNSPPSAFISVLKASLSRDISRAARSTHFWHFWLCKVKSLLRSLTTGERYLREDYCADRNPEFVTTPHSRERSESR